MKLKHFKIEHFRSIQSATITFPENKPVILFGPNNVGKSNILKAFDVLLGEKYPTYTDFQDSDHFNRDKDDFPQISLSASFDEPIHQTRNGESFNTICFTTNFEFENKTENTLHSPTGQKLWISNEDRAKCNFILIDASRDMSRQLSYFSQYSILSKMAKKLHNSLVAQTKTQLDEHFENIKTIFESIPEYQSFVSNLQTAFAGNINGFDHKLEIDLSAYDPNNYFHSLRIIAKEGNQTRSYDEFGTGEQQILLMSFVKAYAQTFRGENFVLGIEEPEAHLHPLAQKWLAKNIEALAADGLQIIITTHSPEFLSIQNLDGFVRVVKEDNLTNTTQFSTQRFCEKCIELGSNAEKTTAETILSYYEVNTFYDQLRAFFARKIILVEGPTEAHSLPSYFRNHGMELNSLGVEIVDCRGKSQIARNYRLFKSYGYECFCLFDSDGSDKEKVRGNEELSAIFGFNKDLMNKEPRDFTFDTNQKYGYFGVDFENYMRSHFENYQTQESEIVGTKVQKAKVISSSNSELRPDFILRIAESIGLINIAPQEVVASDVEEIPF